MSLTELEVKNSKPEKKRYLLPDGDCLYLEIHPSGQKSWLMRFYESNGEKRVTLGRYPDFSLREAREWRNEVRKKAALGEAPMTMKQRREAKGLTFAELFNEYMEKKVLPALSTDRIKSIRGKITCHVLPRIGDTAVSEITETALMNVLRVIEAQGKIDTAHSVRGILGQIFRYGMAIGKCYKDPSSALKGALQPRRVKHRARVQGKENIGALMRAVSSYGGVVVRQHIRDYKPDCASFRGGLSIGAPNRAIIGIEK
jgi:hypothetical protein